MAASAVAAQAGPAPAASTLNRVNLLLGERRGKVAALSISAILSGFTEAGILALVAQVAATLVTGAKQLHTSIGPVHVHASLGTLIATGAQDMELAPWLLVFPSLTMVAALMSFNFIGDGLRDAIDPKDR